MCPFCFAHILNSCRKLLKQLPVGVTSPSPDTPFSASSILHPPHFLLSQSIFLVFTTSYCVNRILLDSSLALTVTDASLSHLVSWTLDVFACSSLEYLEYWYAPPSLVYVLLRIDRTLCILGSTLSSLCPCSSFTHFDQLVLCLMNGEMECGFKWMEINAVRSSGWLLFCFEGGFLYIA